MLRSMYAGVSGLNSHQQMMDVVGNNISNVNTIGFKSSRVTFKEMLNQTIKGASAPQDNRAGTNPQQVGLGVGLGSIDADMSSGNLQPTGKSSDVAIQGDGFFILQDGEKNVFSRAGNFNFDRNGNLYSSSTGLLVQGWKADQGELPTDMGKNNMEAITLDSQIGAKATDSISYSKNIDAAAENTLKVDNLTLDLTTSGYEDSLSFELTPDENSFNTWNFTLKAENAATTFSGGTANFTEKMTGQLELDSNGSIISFVSDDDGSGNTIDFITNNLTVDINGSGETVVLNTPASGDSINSVKLFADSTAPADNNLTLDYKLNAKRGISVDVFDSLGDKHNLEFTLKKVDNRLWRIYENDISIDGSSSQDIGGPYHEIKFGPEGKVESGGILDFTFHPVGPDADQTVELDFSKITQYAGEMSANFENINGNAKGSLESFSFTETGDIIGSYSNGLTQVQARIALANFQNPAGLIRQEGVFSESANSGDAEVVSPSEGGAGSLAPSTLEMSNVNLSQEFTNMITAQRGFQASSKLITTSDEMLQELVNLKR
ncbi:flagellar hook protein FlgE [Halanaerobium sp. DL-01]|uniref:flagellar hook protein FlgE n=1 Tax=Halanaerobium sp. DL-01 TaxID=1653064 RepID=UPI000E144305|nr:flagellar hook protein FlgE [Halanaerobium sp. DL-01]RCW84670.1 flagellar hook protein FlgE [Halanaerobium sp. DL-01]